MDPGGGWSWRSAALGGGAVLIGGGLARYAFVLSPPRIKRTSPMRCKLANAKGDRLGAEGKSESKGNGSRHEELVVLFEYHNQEFPG